jgi:hypothetical protein
LQPSFAECRRYKVQTVLFDETLGRIHPTHKRVGKFKLPTPTANPEKQKPERPQKSKIDFSASRRPRKTKISALKVFAESRDPLAAHNREPCRDSDLLKPQQ